jgi:cyclophilin family peptidyl-prolyl cis-trans isomerase
LKNAVRYLKDVSLDIRRAAVSAFYRLPDSAFAEDLIPVLADSDALVRKYAVSALGKIGLSNLTPKIVPLLHDSVKSVKIQAIRAVGKCKSEIAVAELLKLVESDDYHIFREALDALGNMRPKSAEDYLENLTKKTFGLKLPYLIIALSKIEGERFIPFLDTYSDHPKPEVRRAVANSLSYITGYKALKLAQDMMLDPDPTVRVVIINSLGIQGENARANLEQALNDDDWAVRTSAVECLEKMATSSTFDKITECYLKHLNMTQPEESCIMMQVMYRLDKIRSLKYIYKGLNSPKKEIVFIARNLLKNAGEEIAPPSPPQEKDYPANFGLLLGAPKVSIMTAKGRIEVELFGDDASTVVGNFLRLVKDRFYQGLTFHRVVPDFVVQGGDPHGDGMGGPGYTIRDQINRHKFIRGTVGIANAGLDTGGSQFFICLSPQPHLDGNYTAFGQVVKGFEALDRLYEGDLIDDIVITRQVLPKFREL